MNKVLSAQTDVLCISNSIILDIMNYNCNFTSQALSSFRHTLKTELHISHSGLHSNMLSSCTSVYTGLHLHTLLTSFVRWQMSRLVSDSVPVHLRHWLSAAPDSLLSVTELSRWPLHMSGTVCQILSLPHLLLQSSGPGLKLTCLTFPTPVIVQCLPCAVTLVALNTIIVLAYLHTANLIYRPTHASGPLAI